MANGSYKYIWRCAKCSNHLTNIMQIDGIVKQEKKCPKCKSINILTFANGEIFIKCRFFNPNIGSYSDESGDNYLYPDVE